MSPTPIQMRRPRLSVKLSLLVYTAEAPLHSCRTVGKDRTSRLPGLGHHALLSPIKKSGCRLRAPAAKPCTPDHKLPSGTAAGVGGAGGQSCTCVEPDLRQRHPGVERALLGGAALQGRGHFRQRLLHSGGCYRRGVDGACERGSRRRHQR